MAEGYGRGKLLRVAKNRERAERVRDKIYFSKAHL
jgi:hypothetical protein